MSRYLLCEKRRQRPYVVRELNLRLYSPEEMSYFFYHYLPILDETFLGEELLQYIAEEFGMAMAARAMQQTIHMSKRPLEALVVFLKAAAYYSEDECLQFQKELRRREQRSAVQVALERAGLYEERRLYWNAVGQYRRILHRGVVEESERKLFSELYRKAGNLCMQMGDFEQGIELFQEGFEEFGVRTLAEQFCMACLLAGEELPETSRQLPQQLIEQCRQRFESLQAEAKAVVGDGPVSLVMTEHFQGRREDAERYFRERKERYRN